MTCPNSCVKSASRRSLTSNKPTWSPLWIAAVAKSAAACGGPIRFGPTFGVKTHTSRDVEHDPQDECSLDVPPNVWFSVVGGHPPIDMTDFVARFIGP